MPGKHARLSPSSSNRWINCPGSVSLSETVPRPPPSKYAAEGTVAHRELDAVLNGEPPLIVGAELLYTEDGVEFGFAYDGEMDSAILVAMDYCNEIGGGQHYETRVVPTSISEQCGGRADIIAWHEDSNTLEVIDFKYGAGTFVDIEDNSQLMLYAIGAMDSFDYDAEFVMTTVIQPRAMGAPIRSHTYLAEELREWAESIALPAVEDTGRNDPILAIGDWCKWCPVGEAGKCPARNANAVSVFEIIEDETGELAPLLDKCDELEAWCKSIRGAAKRAIELGEDVPGWKVVQNLGNRKWEDEKEASAYFKKILKVKAFAPAKLKSPAQMEKMVSREAVDEYTVRPLGSQTLVRNSNPEPAIEFAPIFEAIE